MIKQFTGVADHNVTKYLMFCKFSLNTDKSIISSTLCVYLHLMLSLICCG